MFGKGIEMEQDDFPYISTFVTLDDVKKAIPKIASYKLRISEEKPYIIKNMITNDSIGKENPRNNMIGKLIILEEYSVYDEGISGVFTDKQRMTCRRSNEPLSPLDYWNVPANKKSVLSSVRNAKSPKQRMKLLNDEMWDRVKGCGTFRPVLLAGFIDHFSAKSVLDISSGWGDRLIGAIAKEVDYVGVDPNKDLIEPYKEIIEKLAKDKTKYQMICAPFQTAELPENKTYDLIFTSVPYFNLELYTYGFGVKENNEDVSLEQWKIEFLYPSLDKAWSKLDVGGHMCIIIEDFMKYDKGLRRKIPVRYTEDTVRYISSYPDAENMNRVKPLSPYLSYSQEHPRPIWTWRKKPEAKITYIPKKANIEILQLSKSKSLNVINNLDIIEGTLSRSFREYLAFYKDYKELIYWTKLGINNEEIFVRYCETVRIKATIFTNTNKEKDMLKSLSDRNVKVIVTQEEKDALTYEARTKDSKVVGKEHNSAEYIHILGNLIRADVGNINPERLLLFINDGFLLQVLMNTFPNTEFVCLDCTEEDLEKISPMASISERVKCAPKVQKTSDIPEDIRHKLLGYFDEESNVEKVMQVLAYAKNNDYLWVISS